MPTTFEPKVGDIVYYKTAYAAPDLAAIVTRGRVYPDHKVNVFVWNADGTTFTVADVEYQADVYPKVKQTY